MGNGSDQSFIVQESHLLALVLDLFDSADDDCGASPEALKELSLFVPFDDFLNEYSSFADLILFFGPQQFHYGVSGDSGKDEVLQLGSNDFDLSGLAVFEDEEDVGGAHLDDLVFVEPQDLLVALGQHHVGGLESRSVIPSYLEGAGALGCASDRTLGAGKRYRLETCGVVWAHRTPHHQQLGLTGLLDSQTGLSRYVEGPNVVAELRYGRNPPFLSQNELLDQPDQLFSVEVRKR